MFRINAEEIENIRYSGENHEYIEFDIRGQVYSYRDQIQFPTFRNDDASRQFIADYFGWS